MKCDCDTCAFREVVNTAKRCEICTGNTIFAGIFDHWHSWMPDGLLVVVDEVPL